MAPNSSDHLSNQKSHPHYHPQHWPETLEKTPPSSVCPAHPTVLEENLLQPDDDDVDEDEDEEEEGLKWC